MNSNWIKIYTSNDFYKAEMVRQALIEVDMDAVLINKQGYPYNIGEIEIYIQAHHFDGAIELIIKNEL